ncbi:DUF2244 domain-containing protein [Limnohabitans sp. DM1]|uniref:DUF2244 domain-containing protein n=1 Tax=Limnohabitans sp. DM1 TaxID=1597955 RepID=UPI000B7ECA15|nr:DUF2244 domain-containing protein [Limnohabitans sp. DM1]
MSNPTYQFAQESESVLHWQLRRNCSITPSQLAWLYFSLCLVSLGIGGVFWFQGATLVLVFAGFEVVVVGVAFLIYARHATDGERISLHSTKLVVEKESAGRMERAEFVRQWVRVEPKSGDHSLIELSGQGRSMEVGRFVRPELRQMLAREIRKALRSA